MGNIDLNRGPLVSEATALPNEPQPQPWLSFKNDNGPIPASFRLFSSFSRYNFNNTNWKKHRCCAWDSNWMEGADETTELWRPSPLWLYFKAIVNFFQNFAFSSSFWRSRRRNLLIGASHFVRLWSLWRFVRLSHFAKTKFLKFLIDCAFR